MRMSAVSDGDRSGSDGDPDEDENGDDSDGHQVIRAGGGESLRGAGCVMEGINNIKCCQPLAW